MLKALDINKFIKSNSVLEVTNFISFIKNNPTDDGLYSPKIFGTTTEEITKTFGFINLKAQIIHPAIVDVLGKISPIFRKIILGEKRATFESGVITVVEENGNTGPGWLFSIWDRIKFDSYRTDKNQSYIEAIQKLGKDLIFIDKYLVIPPKFRMWTEKHGLKIEDELTGLYKKLLGKVSSGYSQSEFMQEILRNSSRDIIIQKAVLEIYEYFLTLLEKKEGSFRGSLISKRIDANVRLVANARPDIPFNACGLPWHVLLNIFDAFIVGSLNKAIFSENFAKELGIESFSSVKLGEHFNYIFRNVDTYTEANPGKREIWIKLLVEMFNYHPELRVLIKRDPAWNASSYHCLKPVIIPTNSYHIVVNSLLYKPLGGDSFNTNYTAIEQSSNVISTAYGTLKTPGKAFKIRKFDSIVESVGE